MISAANGKGAHGLVIGAGPGGPLDAGVEDDVETAGFVEDLVEGVEKACEGAGAGLGAFDPIDFEAEARGGGGVEEQRVTPCFGLGPRRARKVGTAEAEKDEGERLGRAREARWTGHDGAAAGPRS